MAGVPVVGEGSGDRFVPSGAGGGRVTGGSGSRRPAGRFVLLIGASVVTVGSFALGEVLDRGTTVLGINSIVVSVALYWVSGGSRIDAVGALCLSGMLFTGFAALITPQDHRIVETSEMAILLATTMQIAVVAVAWFPQWRRRGPMPRQRLPRQLRSSTLLLSGVTGFGIGVALSPVEELTNVSMGFLVGSPILAALGAASSARSRWAAGLVPLALILLYLSVWSGGGRLVVLAFLLAIVMVWSYRVPIRCSLLKAIVPCMLVPGLLLGSLVEVNRADVNGHLFHVPSDFIVAENLGSVWSPLYVFTSLLDGFREGALQFHGWHTLWASLVAWVPRPLWPGKPDGWGRDLAWVFNQQAAEYSNHSEAGLFPAEMLWSFGLLGLVLGTLVLGLVVRMVNAGLRRCVAVNPPRGLGAPILAGWIVVATALLPLWWGGTFNFSARVLLQVLAIAALVTMGTLFEKLTLSRSAGRRPATRDYAVRRTSPGLERARRPPR